MFHKLDLCVNLTGSLRVTIFESNLMHFNAIDVLQLIKL